MTTKTHTCLTIACDLCGYVLDADDDGEKHFTDIEDAIAGALCYDWRQLLDGRVICTEGDAEHREVIAADKAEREAVKPIDGQEALEVDATAADGLRETGLPLLLIDVDGPLNPFAAKPTKRPDCYETHRLAPEGWDPRNPLRVWLNPAHGPMLLALADRMTLTWATTWRKDANAMIGPRVGLPNLPVIDVEQPFRHTDASEIWKRPAVEAYVGDRAFAWFDDDFGPGDFRWARERAAAGIPTLLVHVDPAIGIVQADVDKVAAWLAEADPKGSTDV